MKQHQPNSFHIMFPLLRTSALFLRLHSHHVLCLPAEANGRSKSFSSSPLFLNLTEVLKHKRNIMAPQFFPFPVYKTCPSLLISIFKSNSPLHLFDSRRRIKSRSYEIQIKLSSRILLVH